FYFYMMKLFKTKSAKVFFVFMSIIISAQTKAQPMQETNYPLLTSILEINKQAPDTCRIAVFVNSIYNCPPCPKGADCKPCIGDHIMVADSLNGKIQFRVFVKEPAKFSVGEKYTLLIRLYKYNSESEVYEGKLIEKE